MLSSFSHHYYYHQYWRLSLFHSPHHIEQYHLYQMTHFTSHYTMPTNWTLPPPFPRVATPWHGYQQQQQHHHHRNESVVGSNRINPRVVRNSLDTIRHEMLQLARKFFAAAQKRNTEAEVCRDIWTLTKLHISHGTQFNKVLRFAPSEQIEVLRFYGIESIEGPTHLTLKNISKLFPFTACEYLQLNSGLFPGRMKETWIRPEEVAPDCPLFVCHFSFVYLIPNNPSYDQWFDWHLRWRLLTNEKLANKGIYMFPPEKQTSATRFERRNGYLKEEHRVYFLNRLGQLAGVQLISTSVPNSSMVSIPDDSIITTNNGDLNKCEGQLLLDDDTNEQSSIKEEVVEEEEKEEVVVVEEKEIEVVEEEDRDEQESNQQEVSSSHCSSIESSSVDCPDFPNDFFVWASNIAPLKRIVVKIPSPKSHQTLLVYEGVDLHRVAETFYRQAKNRTRQQVFDDLNLLISFYVQHGPYLSTESLGDQLKSVVEFYGLKNKVEDDRTLTLSRVAKIFPWLVCHYAQAYGSDYAFPHPDSIPRYMAPQCFASLIPRNTSFDYLFEQHLECRLEFDRLLRPDDSIKLEVRVARQHYFACQARQTTYLTDVQRIYFLSQLERIHQLS